MIVYKKEEQTNMRTDFKFSFFFFFTIPLKITAPAFGMWQTINKDAIKVNKRYEAGLIVKKT